MTVAVTTADRIAHLRNELTCWVLGKHPLSYPKLKDLILELDNLLQQMEL